MHQFSNSLQKKKRKKRRWHLNVKLNNRKCPTIDDYLQMPCYKLLQCVTRVSGVCDWLELWKGRWLHRQRGTTSSTVDFGWSPIFQSMCQLRARQQLVLAVSKSWSKAFQRWRCFTLHLEKHAPYLTKAMLHIWLKYLIQATVGTDLKYNY